MNLKPVVAAIALVAGALSAQANVSVDLGAYTLNYDDTTSFGSLSSWFNASGDVTGFTWTVPNSVQVSSTGPLAVAFFDTPSFTISANPGWALSGNLNAFLGNMTYTEIGGATTGILAYGDMSVNGGPAVSLNHGLAWTALTSGPSFTQGYFGETVSIPSGPFTTLVVSNSSIVLSSAGGTFGSIVSQPQNKLEFSFMAVAVPEPESYLMFLSGFAVLGWLSARRRRA